jgi:hypothetical protein
MSKSESRTTEAAKPAKAPPPKTVAEAASQASPWGELQQRLGNRAMNALLHSAWSGPHDPLERAADRFADASVRTSAPTPQAEGLIPLRQPDLPAAALSSMLGYGAQPLPGGLRSHFEARLGFDLGRVRVHHGPAAQGLARMLGARAFTLGQDIVLGSAAPAVASAPGRWLLAHEVAHVAQQARGLSAARSALGSALHDLARILTPHRGLTIQRQEAPPTVPDTDAAPAVMPDDPAFDAGVDRAQAGSKNPEWWESLTLGSVRPLRHLDPGQHPHAYANRVRRAQQLMRSGGLLRVEGARLRADGILGPRTFLALLVVARDPAHAARAAIQGLGFDLDAMASAEGAELRARAHARLPEVVLQTDVDVLGEEAVRYYDIHYSMHASEDQEVFDRTIFGDRAPAGLRREDRIEMLHRLYGRGEQRLRGTLEVVQVRRDFFHTRIDVGRAVVRDRRRSGGAGPAHFSFVAASPSLLRSMLLEMDVRPAMERAMARQTPDEAQALNDTLTLLAAQRDGPAPGATQAAAVLMALYWPAVDAARRAAVADAVLAERADRERAEREHIERNNREGAQQRADLLVELITDDDTNHLIIESRLRTELERAVRERTFFDLVLDDLAARPGDMFNRLFGRIEGISGERDLGLLVQAARGGRYADHARVRQAQAELVRRHGDVREHGYQVDPGGDAARGTVLLDGDQRVSVGQVVGDINGAYLRDEDREQLKPAARQRLEAALEDQSRAYMARLLEGSEPERTQDEIGQLLLQQAWAAAQLDTDRDIEDVEWQESIRVLGVRRAADRGDGVPRYEVEYERVQRIVGGEAGGTSWQAIADSRGWRSESDFEYDMFWYPYSQMADVMLAAAIVVTVGAVIVVAWEVGLIAALVSAGGGALPVGLSIGISMAIYMLTHERRTLSGLLLAGVEGYLGAVGFRLFSPVGAAVGRMVIPATLEQVAMRRVIAAWLLRHGTVGALTGGALGPASLLMQDLVRVAGGGGGFSSFAAYLRSAGMGMLLGAVFEIGGSALLAPLFRNADSSVLARVDDVVATLNGTTPRLTPSQWMAHAGACLSATREYLALIMTEANARGVFTVLRERVEQAGSAWLAGARGTLHREIIEMAGARISREAMDGLERLLRLGSARLGDDALATLLQQARRTPERIDPWLRFFSGLDETAAADLVARNQLRALLEAEQVLALALRRTPAEMNTLLGARFAHAVADLDAFAARVNALQEGVADQVLDALRSRGTAVTPRSLLRVAESGHTLDDELFGGLQRLLDGADAARLDAVMDALANDQVGPFLRGAHTATPAELTAMRDMVASFEAAEVAWGVRLPAIQAHTLLNQLTAASRAAIMDLTAAEAQAIVAALTPARVNQALGQGTAGALRGSHLRALRGRWRDASVIDFLDWAGAAPARLGRVTRLAGGLDASAGRLAAGGPPSAATLVLDSNAIFAIEALMRGTPFASLTPNRRDAINALRTSRGLGAYADPGGGAHPSMEHIVGPGADLRASPTSAAEVVIGEPTLGRSPVLDDLRGVGTPTTHPDYDAVLGDLQRAGVGAAKGAPDRTVVADALFSHPGGGTTPRLVTADQDIVLALAQHFGHPSPLVPRTGRGAPAQWAQLLADPVFGTGRFTVRIQGHLLEILFR